MINLKYVGKGARDLQSKALIPEKFFHQKIYLIRHVLFSIIVDSGLKIFHVFLVGQQIRKIKFFDPPG